MREWIGRTESVHRDRGWGAVTLLVGGSGDWEVSLEFLVSSFWFRVAGFGFSRVERVERGERMGMWYRWLVDLEIGRLVVSR